MRQPVRPLMYEDKVAWSLAMIRVQGRQYGGLRRLSYSWDRLDADIMLDMMIFKLKTGYSLCTNRAVLQTWIAENRWKED
jgi:hypothetical protein